MLAADILFSCGCGCLVCREDVKLGGRYFIRYCAKHEESPAKRAEADASRFALFRAVQELRCAIDEFTEDQFLNSPGREDYGGLVTLLETRLDAILANHGVKR